MLQSSDPVAMFPVSAAEPRSVFRLVAWWMLSPVLFRNFLKILGMDVIAFATNAYAYSDRKGGVNYAPVSTMVSTYCEATEKLTEVRTVSTPAPLASTTTSPTLSMT